MTTQKLLDMAVELDGQGKALLCIHGLGGSSNTWSTLMPAFHAKQVIRPDLPGSARSDIPTQPLSIESYVDAMEALLRWLNIDEVHLVAHSMGTIVAQHIAARNFVKVQSLVLFGPLTEPPEAARKNILERAKLARSGIEKLQEIADAVAMGATSTQTKNHQPEVLALVRECIMRQTPEGYARSCEALAGARAAQIENIKVPTLMITGDQDGVGTPQVVAQMADRIARSRAVVVDGCGHWASFENPMRCRQELEEFYGALQ
jgi:pimeloyl-ACP methyl ester carboxylesterase